MAGVAAAAATPIPSSETVCNVTDPFPRAEAADTVDHVIPLPDEDAAQTRLIAEREAGAARHRRPLPVHLVDRDRQRQRVLPILDRADLPHRLRRETGQREQELARLLQRDATLDVD